MTDKTRQKPYARTIPHPLFERLIVEDAMNKEDNEWKPERYHEYGYFPGCVDFMDVEVKFTHLNKGCLLYTSPSPRDRQKSRMPSSA